MVDCESVGGDDAEAVVSRVRARVIAVVGPIPIDSRKRLDGVVNQGSPRLPAYSTDDDNYFQSLIEKVVPPSN